uniref:OmpA family protein n=1 Tax=uncultured Lutibacter sp. TaxID=437739 RepID=UPI0026184372
VELDKVVELMNKYPGMVIRLESHTDSRANDQYNIVLSENRAKSTYDYIISKGISPDRITKYEGFGETQLVNKCSNNVKCTEEEHQLNRRTEFIILKMK